MIVACNTASAEALHKLQQYLMAHPNLNVTISAQRSREFLATDLTNQAVQLAARLYGKSIKIDRVEL